jgi:long-chain acyl-CoA synthetase
MARNIYEAFEKRASRRRGEPAIDWKKAGRWIRMTYGEFLDKVKALSFALVCRYGIKKGDNVAIAIGNRPDWPIAFFALVRAGAIPVPVNSQGSPRDARNILEASGCVMIITEGGLPSFGLNSLVIDSDEFEDAIRVSGEMPYTAAARRGDTACIMYTSGTTSHPKGVVLSHGNLLSNMYSLYKLGFMKAGDGIFSILPLYHTYAMVVTTVGPLVYGGRVIYPGSIRAQEVMAALKESGAKIFIGVPLVFEMFHKTFKESLNRLPGMIRAMIDGACNVFYYIRRKTGINLARYFFYGVHASLGRDIRAYMSGGGKLNENVERDLFRFGFTVLNGYGITETSPVLSVNPANKPKPGSVGLPLKNVEVKIIGQDERGIGEIVVRGPNVMKGYYNNEALTAKALKDGWFRTKDIGYMDKDGYIYVIGRVDDAITLSTGLSISPDELEDAYSAEPAIKEICIFDAPAARTGGADAAIWAVVVPDLDLLSSKGVTDPYAYIKAAIEKVSRAISIPERLMGFYITLDKLPRTLLGKVKRRDVKDRHLAGRIKEAFRPGSKRFSEEEAALLKRPAAEKVLECLKSWAGEQEIHPNDSFELDLGIDLAARSELAYALEKKIGLKMTEDDINKIFTVGELIARAEKNSDKKGDGMVKKIIVVVAVVLLAASASYADSLFDVLSSIVKTTVEGVKDLVTNAKPGKVASDTVEGAGKATQNAVETLAAGPDFK